MGTSRNVERRTILKVAGASAAAVGLGATTACGGDSGSGDGTVTLRYAWWGGEPRTIAIKTTIALFEKKYRKIKINPEFTDYEAFW
jgi:multiple sugar transport system substrate-binding protein